MGMWKNLDTLVKNYQDEGLSLEEAYALALDGVPLPVQPKTKNQQEPKNG